jgi:hypothetical protein
VAQGRLPGVAMVVSRKAKLVYAEAGGMRDKSNGLTIAKDGIFWASAP